MKQIAAAMLLASMVWCARRPPDDWYSNQDWSIEFPDYFQPDVEPDAVIDGPTYRAIRVAADDFMPPTGESLPCRYTPAGHKYRTLRKGDVIFVQIDEDLASCGLRYPALHSTAKYAISAKDGRILRRLLPGEPARVESPDAQFSFDAGDHADTLDGGPLTEWELPDATEPDASVELPGISPDSGTEVGQPDASVPSPAE